MKKLRHVLWRKWMIKNLKLSMQYLYNLFKTLNFVSWSQMGKKIIKIRTRSLKKMIDKELKIKYAIFIWFNPNYLQIVDTFGFLFWIILYLCIVAGILYHDYLIFFMQEDKIDKSSQIAYFGLDFISPLYAICCLLGKLEQIVFAIIFTIHQYNNCNPYQSVVWTAIKLGGWCRTIRGWKRRMEAFFFIFQYAAY